jgi:CRP/FNR family cyclic AMP-dependent transcriptional regulator
MIGTTRSRVSFFMNRFRKLGFVEYNGRIRVHKSLLNVVLHDQPLDNHARSASLLTGQKRNGKSSKLKLLPVIAKANQRGGLSGKIPEEASL